MKRNIPPKKNFFYKYRNLIYGAAIAIGCMAGIFVAGISAPELATHLPSPVAAAKPTLTEGERVFPQALPQPKPQSLSLASPQALRVANQPNVLPKQPLQTELPSQEVEFAAPLQFQGKVVNSVTLKSDRKVIALTFDDGPWTTTPKVLEILKVNQVLATFFMIGRHLQAYPQVAKQVVAEGHAIGNHTWSHGYGKFTPAAAAAEIQRTNNLLYQLTKVRTGLFRPPAGILNNGLAAYSQSQKGTIILWSNDSLDWRSPPPQTIVKNVLKNARSGGIILLHDGGGDRSRTITALPKIIRELKSRGYEFVTVPQLLAIKTST